MNSPPSVGKAGAVYSGVTGSLIIVFMWLCKHYGINDMTEEVATAFVTLAVMMGGGAAHVLQRNEEKKETTK